MSEILETPAVPAIQPVLAKLQAEPGLSGDDRRNAGLILDACALAIDRQNHRPSRIKARLAAVTDGRDDLVPVIERALRDADMDGENRLRLHGALLAARTFLFHLHPHAPQAAAPSPERRYRGIEAVMAELDPADFTDETRQAAATALTACFMSLDPAPVAPAEILAKLTSVGPGYWRWIGEVETAIRSAKAANEGNRLRLSGAFAMLQSCLFVLAGHSPAWIDPESDQTDQSVYPVVFRVLNKVEANDQFSDDDMRQAHRLLTACVMALDHENSNHDTITQLLSGLPNGYSCWLSVIEVLIERADIDDAFKDQMRGSFAMARTIIWNAR